MPTSKVFNIIVPTAGFVWHDTRGRVIEGRKGTPHTHLTSRREQPGLHKDCLLIVIALFTAGMEFLCVKGKASNLTNPSYQKLFTSSLLGWADLCSTCRTEKGTRKEEKWIGTTWHTFCRHASQAAERKSSLEENSGGVQGRSPCHWSASYYSPRMSRSLHGFLLLSALRALLSPYNAFYGLFQMFFQWYWFGRWMSFISTRNF